MEFLSVKQVRNHINELNKSDTRKFLDYEWEVVLLNAFSKLGKICHEKKFGGNSKPDLFFEDYVNSDNNFLADIKTFTDLGYEEKYDIEEFHSTIYKLAKSQNIPLGAFHFHIGHVQQTHLKSKIKIPFPHPQDLSTILAESRIDDFFKFILETPDKRVDWLVFGEEVTLTKRRIRIFSRIIYSATGIAFFITCGTSKFIKITLSLLIGFSA